MQFCNWLPNGINVDAFAGILFGITGGVLTLTALLAIYISLITQQNVQKARELKWNLVGIPHKFDIKNYFAISSEIITAYNLYEEVLRDGINYTHKVISLTNNAITWVVIAWKIGVVGIVIVLAGEIANDTDKWFTLWDISIATFLLVLTWKGFRFY